jgi:hypothetical protein
MRFAILFLSLLLFSSPLLAQTGSNKTATQLNAEINALWPDNSSGLITPYNSRQTLLDMVASSVGTGVIYDTKENGLLCNDTIDDTAAFNALLATVNTAGGGTILVNGMCKIAGQVTFPNTGTATPTQSAIRLTGLGGNLYGQFIAPPTTSPSGLDLTFNAADAKIITIGTGLLEIDHLMLKDSGADCASFIHTTHTTLNVHDNSIQGTGTGFSACNDVFIFGGQGAIDNTLTSAFQGYGTTIRHNTFDKIRKGAVFNGAANAIMFTENSVSLTAGDGTTKAITAATNANPAVLTSANHGFAVGDKIRLNISGATGNWAPINGATVAITVINANTFSVPVDSTTFGALTGSPHYMDGTFLEFAGSAMYSTAGNYIAGNLVEMVNYAYFARLANSLENQFSMNNLFDAPAGLTVSFFKSISAAANGGMIFNGYVDGGTPILVGTARAALNVLNGSASAPTLDVQTQWATNSNYLGLNSYVAGAANGATSGIRSDAFTQFTWSGPANFNRGANSTSTVSGDVVTSGGIGVGQDVTVGGVLTVQGLVSRFGVAGSAIQIFMPQTNGLGAIMNADGSNLVFRNSGAGAMFFDSFGNGTTNFRSAGGSTTQMTLDNSGNATVLLRLAAANLQSKTVYSAAGTPVPTCNGAAEGTRVSVSDTTAPTYHSVYTSGGGVHGPLYCDGTNWLND